MNMNTDFQQYAYIPLKQFSNRVWRTYEGGALIDKWKKDSPEVDGSLPEEWIMSTVTARVRVDLIMKVCLWSKHLLELIL